MFARASSGLDRVGRIPDVGMEGQTAVGVSVRPVLASKRETSGKPVRPNGEDGVPVPAVPVDLTLPGRDASRALIAWLSNVGGGDGAPSPSSSSTTSRTSSRGWGTPKASGGGRAPSCRGWMLERILASDAVRVVATTHSPRLRALSVENDLFTSPSVLIGDDGVPSF